MKKPTNSAIDYSGTYKFVNDHFLYGKDKLLYWGVRQKLKFDQQNPFYITDSTNRDGNTNSVFLSEAYHVGKNVYWFFGGHGYVMRFKKTAKGTTAEVKRIK